MKVRSGFVSNSSSSSFVIYGVALSSMQVDELRVKDAESLHDEYEILEALPEGMNYVSDGESDVHYIGAHPFHGMKDDETKAQFMERVQGLVNSVVQTKATCELHEGTIYS